MRVGILTSGGDCQALNVTMRGLAKTLYRNVNDIEIIGFLQGYKGLMYEDYKIMKPKDFSGIINIGGTILGTSRCPFKKMRVIEDDFDKVAAMKNTYAKLKLDCLVVLGGNGSIKSANMLSQEGLNVIALPKTIDNDLMGTDHTPGFGSAAKYVATTMKEIVYDSMIYQLQSITIVEIMGRNAGWLTAAACLARNENNTAPDLIYLPEVPFTKENFINSIAEVFKHKRGVVIAVSEGIRDENGNFLDQDSRYAKKDAFGHIIHSGTGKVLETIAYQAFHCKVRSIELNVLQRCAMHCASKMDIDETINVGKHAVLAAKNGETAKMVVIERKADWPYEAVITTKPVNQIANLEKKVPIELIAPTHNDVAPEMWDYLFPLIQGEIQVEYEYGVPKYLDVSHLEKEW